MFKIFLIHITCHIVRKDMSLMMCSDSLLNEATEMALVNT